MPKKNVVLLSILPLIFLLFTSCQLVFEPEYKAINRLFAGFAQGYSQPVRDMTEEGSEVRKSLERLGAVISSEWYNAKEGFFTITSIEIVEETGKHYVYVDLILPQKIGNPRTRQLVFEMERIKLRWQIYSVTGIEDFLHNASRERGIL